MRLYSQSHCSDDCSFVCYICGTMVTDSKKFPPYNDLVKKAANKRKHVDPKLFTLLIKFLREEASR